MGREQRVSKASVRTFRGVLKAAVHDSAEELRLEQEVAESRRVDAHVALLDGLPRLGARGVGGRLLLLLVIQEFLLFLGGLIVSHLDRTG
jgi:hypothetical protein